MNEHAGTIKLFHSAGIEHDYSIIIHDGIQSVSDRKNGAVAEFYSNRRLNIGIRLNVDGRRRFVEHENARLPKERTRQTYELSLTDAENRIEQ